MQPNENERLHADVKITSWAETRMHRWSYSSSSISKTDLTYFHSILATSLTEQCTSFASHMFTNTAIFISEMCHLAGSEVNTHGLDLQFLDN